jgi:cystathionine beta-lyase/cystathionine gamma-synthase
MELGADLVVESLTKVINGHSDVVLGGLCGREDAWQRMPEVLSTWGWCSSPWDCWLALRGMETLAVRLEKACDNAQRTAELLAGDSRVAGVHYPGLPDHPDHALARRQFGDRFGTMVAFTLTGGWDAAARFIQTARQIPFCPSLGELSTTLSHPASTSHRGLSEEQRRELGIGDGTLRLSLGIESFDLIRDSIEEGLRGISRR